MDFKHLKSVYSEIINGFSTLRYKNRFIYLKHLNHIDSADIDYKYSDFLLESKSKGLLYQSEKLTEIKEKKLWLNSQDERIKEIINYIDTVEITKSKLPLKKDRDETERLSLPYRNELISLQNQKDELIGLTAERMANEQIHAYYIYYTLYKDVKCTIRLFNEDEFGELEDEEINNLIFLYNQKTKDFSNDILKRVGLMPFFINLLILSGENPFYFFGKPIVELTFYQIDLFGYGRQYKNILSSSQVQPPPSVLEDPDKLLEWFNSNNAANKLMKDDGNQDDVQARSMMGARKSDYKNIGIVDENIINVGDALKKKGGALEMEDILKLHGG